MKMYGTGRVARELGLGRARLLALLDRGLVPEPPLRIDGRRLFTAEDVEGVRLALAKRAGRDAAPNRKGGRRDHGD